MMGLLRRCFWAPRAREVDSTSSVIPEGEPVAREGGEVVAFTSALASPPIMLLVPAPLATRVELAAWEDTSLSLGEEGACSGLFECTSAFGPAGAGAESAEGALLSPAPCNAEPGEVGLAQ